MGLVLDSGVLIAAERDARPVSELLAKLEHEHGETEIVLSSISVIELEHGLHRAQTAEQARKRREYLDTVFAAIPIEPFTREMAQLAAKRGRRGPAVRLHDSVRGPADRRSCTPLRLRGRYPEPAALPDDSQLGNRAALRPRPAERRPPSCLACQIEPRQLRVRRRGAKPHTLTELSDFCTAQPPAATASDGNTSRRPPTSRSPKSVGIISIYFQ